MKNKIKNYRVSIQFESYDFYNIRATSAKEAKEKALKRLGKKQLKNMLDKQNTYVEKNTFTI